MIRAGFIVIVFCFTMGLVLGTKIVQSSLYVACNTHYKLRSVEDLPLAKQRIRSMALLRSCHYCHKVRCF